MSQQRRLEYDDDYDEDYVVVNVDVQDGAMLTTTREIWEDITKCVASSPKVSNYDELLAK